jgi:hypothetical protein
LFCSKKVVLSHCISKEIKKKYSGKISYEALAWTNLLIHRKRNPNKRELVYEAPARLSVAARHVSDTDTCTTCVRTVSDTFLKCLTKKKIEMQRHGYGILFQITDTAQLCKNFCLNLNQFWNFIDNRIRQKQLKMQSLDKMYNNFLL